MSTAFAALLIASTTTQAAQALAGYTVYAGNDQCPTNNSVSQVAGKPWTLGPTIAVGHCPAGIAFAPGGSRAYVLNVAQQGPVPDGLAQAPPRGAQSEGHGVITPHKTGDSSSMLVV